jgi:hypothetical protein
VKALRRGSDLMLLLSLLLVGLGVAKDSGVLLLVAAAAFAAAVGLTLAKRRAVRDRQT